MNAGSKSHSVGRNLTRPGSSCGSSTSERQSFLDGTQLAGGDFLGEKPIASKQINPIINQVPLNPQTNSQLMDAVSHFNLVKAMPQKIGAAPKAEKSLFIPVTTLVLWFGCVCISAIGLTFPYSRPLPPSKLDEPIRAEILNVNLTIDPLPMPDAETPADLAQPPLLEPLVAPQIPPLLAVAEPSPAVAFALPVEGPAKIVEAKQASFARPAETTPTITAPPAQPLTFGEGEGKQPAPDYPRQAIRSGQEGTVNIRFSVGETGRVLSAEQISSSPWPLLNEAALRVVRERWRFRSGPVRVYEVSIHFVLKK